MSLTLRFVDKIDASPTTRLDLNSGVWSASLDGTDFGFPELNRAVVSTMLQDGARIPAAAYGPRTLTLRLLTETTDADAVATQKQALFRELNRPSNLLQFAPNTTSSVFFRTFRSAPTSVQVVTIGKAQWTVVSIMAEPFAYGLREDVAGVSVAHNPASANGRYFDVSGVKGDVDTPAFIRISGGNDALIAMGIRRRGTPGNVTWFRQCEAMTQGTDTSTQANDAAMSGSGNNYSRTSFGTASMTTRLSGNTSDWLGTTVDARGRYRIFVRLRKSSAGSAGDHKVRMRWGGLSTTTLVTGDTVSVPGATGPFMLDLGVIQVPVGSDPQTIGLSGTDIAPQGVYLELQAQRVTGTATLDWDYVIAVPADAGFALVDFTGVQATPGTFPAEADNLILDGPNDTVYAADADPLTTGKVFSHPGHPVGGGLVKLTPNQTNRVVALVQRSTTSDIVTGSDTFTVSYYPAYLFDRPVST